MNTDPLMQLLTVCAALHRVHHDVFGSHKRQFAAEMLLDHFRVYYKAVADVGVEVQDAVYCKEGLRDADALIGGIVQSALEPLGRFGDAGIETVDNHIARKRRDAL